MQHLLALFPVIITLFLAFKTRRMLVALTTGILTASLMFKDYNPYEALLFATQKLLLKSELTNLLSLQAFWQSEKLFIFIFLVAVGALIELIRRSGASEAYSHLIKRRLQGRSQAEFATLGLSAFLFLDDYFNVITTASVMRQITDIFGIARLRCAQLIGNMAASTSAIFPFSTWGAAIAGTLASAGINLSDTGLIAFHPFSTYMWSIPFAFYPITLIFITWVTTAERILIGQVHTSQDLADLTTNVHSGSSEPHTPQEKNLSFESKATFVDFFVPIGVLILSLAIALFYTGRWSVFGGENSFLQALESSNLSQAMFLSSVYSFLIACIWLIRRKIVSLSDAAASIKEGWLTMLPSILVLTLSWTFGGIISQDLMIGKIFVDYLLPIFSVSYLPPAFFIIAAATSFCLGSSWGTMTLLYPIGIAITAQLQGTAPDVILYQTIGAILSGAILGSNTSPLSDLSAMVSSITETSQMDYIQAQIDFNRPIFWGVLAGFLSISFLNISSFGLSAATGLLISILASWISIKIHVELRRH